MQKEIMVTTPNISEETLKEMKKFFMKTSIPRIMKEKQTERKGA